MAEKKGTILFAEDDKSIRHVIEILAPKYLPHHNIETFPDGNSIEARLVNGELGGVSAIVLDNGMPGINGSEIIKRYANEERFKSIPFVLHYGGDESIGEQAVRDGAVTYFRKPTGLSHLAKFLEKY